MQQDHSSITVRKRPALAAIDWMKSSYGLFKINGFLRTISIFFIISALTLLPFILMQFSLLAFSPENATIIKFAAGNSIYLILLTFITGGVYYSLHHGMLAISLIRKGIITRFKRLAITSITLSVLSQLIFFVHAPFFPKDFEALNEKIISGQEDVKADIHTMIQKELKSDQREMDEVIFDEIKKNWEEAGPINSNLGPYLKFFTIAVIILLQVLFSILSVFLTPIMVLGNLSLKDSIFLCFKGILRNLLPLLVLFTISSVMALVLLIPLSVFILCTFGLGMILIIPAAMGWSYFLFYTIFSDIFLCEVEITK